MTIDPKFVDMIKRNNYVILDVETSGKERNDAIIEVAIIDANNNILLHTKVDAMRPISPEATRIHGITGEDLVNAPLWAMARLKIKDILEGKDVVIYNAKHERMLFHQSDEQAGLTKIDWKEIGTWYCAMEFYAQVWNEPNEKFANPKWQSLKNATMQQGLEPGIFHSALEDCFMTAQLCIHIANYPERVKTFSGAKPEPKPFELTHNVRLIRAERESDLTELARLLSLGWQWEGSLSLIDIVDGNPHAVTEVFLTRKF